MSLERAEQIRRWHERSYAAAKAEGLALQTFDYLGLTLAVPPGVQPITRMSDLLGNAVLAEVRAGDRVLDMGTGCGVNAILAASKSRRVVAVDLNPGAVAAARGNVVRNGVAEAVQVRAGDLFSSVDGRFDLIVFDPPFRWYRPRDTLEAAMTDENYQVLRRFVAQAGQHLAPGGRMLIAFGTSGDMDYLREILDVHGFDADVAAQRSLTRDGVRVDYLVFRVMPRPSYASVTTARGSILVAYRGDALALVASGDEAAFLSRAARALGSTPRREPSPPPDVALRLQQAVDGHDDDGPLDLAWLAPFRRRVIEIVRSIPRGEVRSYGWVAREAGSPRAMRAVGSTLAGNPFGPLVPCHRVRRTDGSAATWGEAEDRERDGRLAQEGVDLELLAWLSHRGLRYCGSRTDRVFCLPACPRWRALGARPIYFHTAAEARATGYGACPQCKPVGETGRK
ncbi:MAG TPA: methylated-DNA--[protein]-cysteine S-methyltransferase [Bacillota bacterium]|nr:methylated-DNA--[protein]-cysteine S-methyltransferase [Bacillota bacterium]